MSSYAPIKRKPAFMVHRNATNSNNMMYNKSSSSTSSASSTPPTASSIHHTLYRRAEQEEGKQLSKNQLRQAYVADDTSTTHNDVLSDETIRTFVVQILTERGGIQADVATDLMDDEACTLMRRAFTHRTMSMHDNYEVLETLGDTSFNKIVAFYMMRRFPELRTDPQANYKLTEAMKIYKSKTIAEKFSDTLGLPSLARYRECQIRVNANETKIFKMDSKFKTDLFEAFLAGIEDLIDGKIHVHAGYAVVYNILQSLLDDIPMTINLDKIKSAKVLLKECIDKLHGNMYINKLKNHENHIIGVEITVYIGAEYSLNRQEYRCRYFNNESGGEQKQQERACLDALDDLKERYKHIFNPTNTS